ncbi:HD domain-containing protein [Paenibacillus albiflavus]|uniref:HD domain-containing protein n=1 Tax=Paenibacillus albiflavus TaxID=2545760 RepID=A0A4R4EF38_9BACL|nr:HD domain-containing phosphohydrolase [Paenibacillus albiflavus]TCZ77700.1 HD domain-containing protein [Paenibacillus albiflavus]
MRYVHLDTIESGHFLGKTIFNSNGVVLLSEGVQLTVYMITQLRRIGVTMLYIKDPNFDDVVIDDVVSEETKQAVMRQMDGLFQAIRSGKDFNPKNISTSIDKLLEDVMRNQDLLVQLTDIRTHDNSHYMHAINVCMMSVLTGLSMGLNPTQLKELAIGALLHDIGKIEIPTDETAAIDVKNHHTWRGFEMLKQKREYSLLIAHVAFQHHEHVDGSGIPRQLEDEQIHLYAKIVAVANTYDSMLFRSAEEPLLPHEACEKLMSLSGTQLDRETLVHFLKMVSVYPTGASVRLSTKEAGVVVGQHRGLPGRPIIRIIKQDNNDREFDVKEMDLAKETTVFIENVLS